MTKENLNISDNNIGEPKEEEKESDLEVLTFYKSAAFEEQLERIDKNNQAEIKERQKEIDGFKSGVKEIERKSLAREDKTLLENLKSDIKYLEEMLEDTKGFQKQDRLRFIKSQAEQQKKQDRQKKQKELSDIELSNKIDFAEKTKEIKEQSEELINKTSEDIQESINKKVQDTIDEKVSVSVNFGKKAEVEEQSFPALEKKPEREISEEEEQTAINEKKQRIASWRRKLSKAKS